MQMQCSLVIELLKQIRLGLENSKNVIHISIYLSIYIYIYIYIYMCN
jgi:hypothetical protein